MARSKITKSFTYEGKRHYVSAPTGRLIIWDDVANSWVQIKRWA